MKYLVLRKEGEAWAIAEFAEFADAANEWLRLVHAVDAPPSERIGLPAVGRATVRVYLWAEDA